MNYEETYEAIKEAFRSNIEEAYDQWEKAHILTFSSGTNIYQVNIYPEYTEVIKRLCNSNITDFELFTVYNVAELKEALVN